jgi:4'-phosphopantetheinyl transferase
VVVIVAVAGYGGGDGGDDGVPVVEVGVDVVCTSERRTRDHAMLAGEGWPAFVDMHADVFAPGEVAYLKHRVLEAVPGLVAGATVERINDGKLRAFYTLWALREAYVKLTGEALLAEWLKDLEFRGFRPPRPTAGWDVPAREEEGEVVRDIEIWFKGARVEDVNISLRSMGEDFMIATAVRTPGRKEDGLGWALGPYEALSLEQVLDFAEGR